MIFVFYLKCSLKNKRPIFSEPEVAGRSRHVWMGDKNSVYLTRVDLKMAFQKRSPRSALTPIKMFQNKSLEFLGAIE